MGELLSSLAGIKLKHVPYRGSAPSLQDMLAGAIPSMFDPITTNVPHINAGKVRLLAISSGQAHRHVSRHADLRRAGLPAADDLDLGRRLRSQGHVAGGRGAGSMTSCRRPTRRPTCVERFKDVVLLPGDKPMTPAEYAQFVGDFAVLWAGVSKSAGISNSSSG